MEVNVLGEAVEYIWDEVQHYHVSESVSVVSWFQLEQSQLS